MNWGFLHVILRMLRFNEEGHAETFFPVFWPESLSKHKDAMLVAAQIRGPHPVACLENLINTQGKLRLNLAKTM